MTSAAEVMLPSSSLPGRLAFSPDGTLLATACLDKKTRIWGVADGVLRATLTGPDDGVTAVSFARGGSLLATASEDGTVRVWDTGNWAVQRALTHPGHELTDVAFSPGGRQIAAKSRDAVLLWDTATWTVHATVTGSRADGIALAVSADGRQLATACADRTLRIWDTAAGTARTVLADETVPVMEFTPDGTGLLTVSDNGAVRRLDITAPAAALTAASEGPWGEVAAVSPGGRLLATTPDGPESGTVRVWDTAAGAPCAVIAAADSWADPDDKDELRIPGAAFSPDGTLLATTSMMGRAFLWDAATGAPRATPAGHDRGWAVTSVAFSSDGKLVATGRWTGPPGSGIRGTAPCAPP